MATVEQIEGVHFRELFARLPKRAPNGDAAIAAVWARLETQSKLFAPLLFGIAAVAQGNEAPRAQIEAFLPPAEEKGSQLSALVQRIWAGERD